MKSKKYFFNLFSIGTISILTIVLLFILSENTMHRNNAFTRRYPHHPVSKKYDLSLKYNSYYIAGFENEKLYLGNHTAPTHLLEINLKTKDTNHIRIKLNADAIAFRTVQVKIRAPYFFVMDGTVPCVFRGKMRNWIAKPWMQDVAYFSKAIPIDSNKLFIKAINRKTRKSVLGIIEKENGFKLKLAPELLETQIDGVFCVDGVMVSSNKNGNHGYVYYYRNQFMILDSKQKLFVKGKTIDTVQKAQLQLSKRNDKGEVKMKAPPLIINKSATIRNNLLLINSNRLGKYENSDMLDNASIIDVYNWKKETYEFSFYLYSVNGKKLSEFQVYEDYLVALIENTLSVYQLKPSHFSNKTYRKNQELVRLNLNLK